MSGDEKKEYELRPVSEEESYFRKLYRMIVEETIIQLEAEEQEKNDE
jgi:hypothetical protein